MVDVYCCNVTNNCGWQISSNLSFKFDAFDLFQDGCKKMRYILPEWWFKGDLRVEESKQSPHNNFNWIQMILMR